MALSSISEPAPSRSSSAPRSAELGPDAPRRRFAWACAIGSVVAGVGFSWMLTRGTFDFFQSQLFSDFYDAQARALFHGHWYMPARILSIEAIRVNGHSYMYYGPVPSLLRMPVLALTSGLDGRLTQPSMLLAFAVAMASLSRLGWKIRQLLHPETRVSRLEAALTGAWVATVGLGSVLLYLASRPAIYHEAEIWGAALALASFDALLAYLSHPSGRALAAAGAFATLSLLTRGSVGAGPLAAIGIIAAAALVAAGHRRWLDRRTSSAKHAADTGRARLAWLGLPDAAVDGRFVLGLVAATLVPVVLYCWINEVKFHTLLSLPLQKQVFTALSANRRAALAANGGSLFGVKFLPTALLEYLRPDNLSFHRLFPFIGFPGAATLVGAVRYDTLDWSSSATATMPALVATGVIGLVATVRASSRRRLAVLRIPLLGGAIGCGGALAIAYIANRYLADFLPFIVLASLAGLYTLVEWAGRQPRWIRRLGGAVLGALALFGVWANSALGLQYQRSLSPGVTLAVRAGFVSFQQNLDDALFGNPPTGVGTGTALPRPGPPGELFVLDQCQGLYQSDGRSWHAVERTRSTGLVEMRLTFPSPPAGTRQPLLVTGVRGQGDFLAIAFLGSDRIAVSYLFQSPGEHWINGAPIKVAPGRTYRVDATLDSRIHRISVTINGSNVFDDSYYVRPATHIYVGQDPIPGPVAPRFTGTIEQLPVSTPICDKLVQRMRQRP